MRTSSAFLIGSLLALTACQIYPPTPTPDYTIHVTQSPNGSVAIPPECPSWSSAVTDPYDNQPVPQYGCANTRNLALMVDKPDDLVKGRDMGPGRGTTTVGSIRRYDNNQTRGLIDPSSSPDTAQAITTAPTTASAMTGDAAATGSGGGGGSANATGLGSSSSSAAAP